MSIKLKPMFRLRLVFHFREHGNARQHFFLFGEDLIRRVPLSLSGVDGLNTIAMQSRVARTYSTGEACEVDCTPICPSLFQGNIAIGTPGQLWDAGYFADVEVIQIYD